MQKTMQKGMQKVCKKYEIIVYNQIIKKSMHKKYAKNMQKNMRKVCKK